jgi:xanthosine utilization system XapX-like protein
MANRIVAGVAAGAAGVMALNVVSYLDMLVRGRPASKVPARVAARIADEIGLPLDFGDIDGDEGAETDVAAAETALANRHDALGALLGMLAGVSIGVMYAVVRLVLPRPPTWLAGTTLGSLAMAAADYPATRLGVTDPRDWSAFDWASDIAPHMAYGVTTAVIFESIKK